MKVKTQIDLPKSLVSAVLALRPSFVTGYYSGIEFVTFYCFLISDQKKDETLFSESFDLSTYLLITPNFSLILDLSVYNSRRYTRNLKKVDNCSVRTKVPNQHRNQSFNRTSSTSLSSSQTMVSLFLRPFKNIDQIFLFNA